MHLVRVSMVKKGGGYCKPGKENKGVRGRCVKKCTKHQKRKNGVGPCTTRSKPGHVLNRLSGRFVKKDGPTGRWVLGKTNKNPATGNFAVYREIIAHQRRLNRL